MDAEVVATVQSSFICCSVIRCVCVLRRVTQWLNEVEECLNPTKKAVCKAWLHNKTDCLHSRYDELRESAALTVETIHNVVLG